MVNAKFSWLFLIAGLVIVGFLLKPFFTAIAFAAVTAFLWHPLHFKLRKRISENWSATLITILTAMLVIFLVLSGVSMIMSQFSEIYMFFSKFDVSATLSATPDIGNAISDVTRFFLTKIIASLSAFASKIPYVFLSLLIYFITLFFFLKDGEKIAQWIKRVAPLNPQKKEQVFKDLNNYAHAFINVWLLIGILQFFVAIIGFMIFGLPFALLAGLLAAVLSILPVIGPYALYIPLGIILALRGDVSTGIGLMVYGLAIGSVLDYGLRPYLASRWSTVHPMIILLGIFGGIAALGPAGFIIGPMILMIVATFFKDYGFIRGSK